MFFLEIDKVPESYIKYYNENRDRFNASIDLEIDDDIYSYINEKANELDIDVNIFVNYALLKFVINEKSKDENGFGMIILHFDIELFEEDEFISMIEENKSILLYDEKAEKAGVILSIDAYEEFEKFKNLSLTV